MEGVAHLSNHTLSLPMHALHHRTAVHALPCHKCARTHLLAQIKASPRDVRRLAPVPSLEGLLVGQNAAKVAKTGPACKP